METLAKIEKTREYLDYIEEHVKNVQKAWRVMTEKCKHMRFIYDDLFYNSLGGEVECHDMSKLSEEEFVQYRKAFFPTKKEGERKLGEAWEYHKARNSHHWQNWGVNTRCCWHPNDWEADCAHMILDWMAMGYKFGDTAQEYYEAHKDEINIPDIAIPFMYEIFEAIRE
jgi:hypothetical protein